MQSGPRRGRSNRVADLIAVAVGDGGVGVAYPDSSSTDTWKNHKLVWCGGGSDGYVRVRVEKRYVSKDSATVVGAKVVVDDFGYLRHARIVDRCRCPVAADAFAVTSEGGSQPNYTGDGRTTEQQNLVKSSPSLVNHALYYCAPSGIIARCPDFVGALPNIMAALPAKAASHRRRWQPATALRERALFGAPILAGWRWPPDGL